MNVGESKSYSYTGGIQTYTIETSGIYKLEVWGCKGTNSTSAGGAGGYSKGYIKLKKGTTLYIGCGGQTYNGGGASWGYNVDMSPYGWDSYQWHGVAKGGGGTHIALVTGTIASIGAANLSKILIIAGGGGGGSDNGSSVGGTGGGTSGGSPSGSTVAGGTQTSGYAFGQGGYGAGGGLYGGKKDGFTASGGSGYIGGVTSYNGDSPSTTNGKNSDTGKATITLMKKVTIKVGTEDADAIYVGKTEASSICVGNTEI